MVAKRVPTSGILEPIYYFIGNNSLGIYHCLFSICYDGVVKRKEAGRIGQRIKRYIIGSL
jgi:hypothetical protein